VTGETPGKNATGVAVSMKPTATFNEAVVASTIGFTLKTSAGVAVGATVAYNSTTNTATLTPSAALASGTTYTATVSVAKNSSGTGMSGPFTWSFTTSTSTSPPAPAPPQGLVAAYSFNEGTGTTVEDSSGNGNTGTITNATWSTAGKYGDALSFNGTNALVTVKDSASLNLTTAMTLEAWVDPSAVSSAWRDVVYKGNDNYFLEATSNQNGLPAAGATIGSSDAFTAGKAALASNTWTFLSETYNGATLALYVNGVQVSSIAETGNILTSTNALQIGGDSTFGQYFNGLIDNVRIYNTALTQAQIQTDMTTAVSSPAPSVTSATPGSGATAVVTNSGVTATFNKAVQSSTIGWSIKTSAGSAVSATVAYNSSTNTVTMTPSANLAYSTMYIVTISGAEDTAGDPMSGPVTWSFTTAAPPPPQGLVAAYSFNEGTGTTVGDSSGNGNTGTITNATWSTAGKYGDALSFNGTNAMVTVKNSASLDLTTAMTLEAWVDPSAVSSAWRDVVYKGNDNYFLEATSSQNSLPAAGATNGSSDVFAAGTAALANNTWTFLTETYNGATLALYVNGVQVSSLPESGNILTSTNSLQIGGDSIYGQYFQGLIDNVRIYNTALTQAQIKTDMTTAVTTTAPAVVAETPTSSATNVAASTTAKATFNEVGSTGRTTSGRLILGSLDPSTASATTTPPSSTASSSASSTVPVIVQTGATKWVSNLSTGGLPDDLLDSLAHDLIRSKQRKSI
jgi:Concanavalin A-like lectin/glucanases superfamily/Bacterial Ig-like domain